MIDIYRRLYIHEFASDLSGEINTVGPLRIDGIHGTTEAISVFKDTAAIMLVDFTRGVNDKDGHKIVIVNWKTGASAQIDPDLPLVGVLCTLILEAHLPEQDVTRVGVQLYNNQYILYWQRHETVTVELRSIPKLNGPSTRVLPEIPPATKRGNEISSIIQGWDWSQKLRMAPPFLNLHDENSEPTLITSLLFPSISQASPIIHSANPIVQRRGTKELTFGPTVRNSIEMPKIGCCPRKLALGPSGRRAVWLEQDYDSDNLDLRLMRLAPNVNDSGFNIKELRPNTLPFLTSEIHCMAFDEVSTRLVLSMIQGDIWALDFA